MKVLVYHGYELSSLAPEWAELSDEVLVKNANGEITPGWYRLPEQRDFKVCYNSVWADRLADGIEQAQKRYGFDGLYLDGTIEPWACCNERHGCGYRAADGKLRPTYPIFGVRRFMQRLYGMVHPRGGLISAHQSTCCVTPTLAFADSYWDGEQFSGGELSGDPLKNLPLDAFRAEFMGRNFGVPCEFLAYERPPQWTFDHALAFSMLHDVRVRPCGLAALEKMSPIWSVMTRFDVTGGGVASVLGDAAGGEGSTRVGEGELVFAAGRQRRQGRGVAGGVESVRRGSGDRAGGGGLGASRRDGQGRQRRVERPGVAVRQRPIDGPAPTHADAAAVGRVTASTQIGGTPHSNETPGNPIQVSGVKASLSKFGSSVRIPVAAVFVLDCGGHMR